MGQLRNGATFGSIVREYFPDASDDEVEYLVWNETGYPAFWTGDPEECFRLQIAYASCRVNFAMFDHFDAWRKMEAVMESQASQV